MAGPVQGIAGRGSLQYGVEEDLDMDTVADLVKNIEAQVLNRSYGVKKPYPGYVDDTIEWIKDHNAEEMR